MIRVTGEREKTVHLACDVQKKDSARMMTKCILKETPIRKLLPSGLRYEKCQQGLLRLARDESRATLGLQEGMGAPETESAGEALGPRLLDTHVTAEGATPRYSRTDTQTPAAAPRSPPRGPAKPQAACASEGRERQPWAAHSSHHDTRRQSRQTQPRGQSPTLRSGILTQRLGLLAPLRI